MASVLSQEIHHIENSPKFRSFGSKLKDSVSISKATWDQFRDWAYALIFKDLSLISGIAWPLGLCWVQLRVPPLLQILWGCVLEASKTAEPEHCHIVGL